MTLPMLMSWCPGKGCDPCQSGQIELIGNYQGQNVLLLAGGSIIVFPEFPVTVKAAISFLGTIANPASGSGSASASGQSYSLGVTAPFESVTFDAPPGWNVNGSDLLLFNVKASSSTTSYAALSTGSVTVRYHSGGSVYNLLNKVRWTGDAS